MTHNTRAALAQLEIERHTASQARREVADYATVAWANALERSGELALAGRLAESRRVLDLAKGAK